MTSTSTSATSAATGKKSLFKRPAWATNIAPAESRDFFRHSDAVYEKILKEKENKREEHAQKKQEKNSGADAVEVSETKRRKVSRHEKDQRFGEQDDSSEAGSEENHIDNTVEPGAIGSEAALPKMLAPQLTRAGSCGYERSSNKALNADSIVIELDSNDGEPEDQRSKAKHMAQNVASEDEASEEEDEYVLELKKKARERARLKELGKDSTKMQSRESAGPRAQPQPHPHPKPSSSSHDAPSNTRPSPAPHLSILKDETIVQILITTDIPGAKPLLVNRKVSQPLQQVREVWCARQDFDDEMAARILFTWRGKRLYDTSTSINLLNVLKREQLRRKRDLLDEVDDDEADGNDPSEGRIEVVAITREMFDKQQQRLREKRDEPNTNVPGDAEYGGPDIHQPEAPKEPEYKVMMNAQGLEALQLKVRPSTAVSKVMVAYRKVRGVDAQKTCWLVFDGDRLEPDSTIGDTEIEDGDALEVHIR